MTSWWPGTLGIAVVLLLAPLADKAHACSCMSSGPPCQAAFVADVVFAGSLPPGMYVFGINLTKRPGAPRPGASVFLPGVFAAKDATLIELKAGDEKVVGVLRLPDR
jgi:hypothetical protein